jgi:hypothetical protein
MATLWFIQAYSLLRNALLASHWLAMDYSITILLCYIDGPIYTDNMKIDLREIGWGDVD